MRTPPRGAAEGDRRERLASSRTSARRSRVPGYRRPRGFSSLAGFGSRPGRGGVGRVPGAMSGWGTYGRDWAAATSRANSAATGAGMLACHALWISAIRADSAARCSRSSLECFVMVPRLGAPRLSRRRPRLPPPSRAGVGEAFPMPLGPPASPRCGALPAVEVGHQTRPPVVAPHADAHPLERCVLDVPPVAPARRLLRLVLEVALEDGLLRGRVPVAAADVLAPAVARISGGTESGAGIPVRALGVDREPLGPLPGDRGQARGSPDRG